MSLRLVFTDGGSNDFVCSFINNEIQYNPFIHRVHLKQQNKILKQARSLMVIRTIRITTAMVTMIMIMMMMGIMMGVTGGG